MPCVYYGDEIGMTGGYDPVSYTHLDVYKRQEYKNAQRMDVFVRGGRRMERKKLPVGIDSFEKLRREAFYYVDKQMCIRDSCLRP